MSIDFAKLVGLQIPVDSVMKVVTQIEDSAGRVLWESDPIFDGTFKVEKITSDTYANQTTYTGEQFILLDVYPKTNGTVYVTYEGVTKTITDTSGVAEPNAQSVFFGTFYGVADEVNTPVRGIVTITGDWRGAGCGVYAKAKASNATCTCITAVGDLSGVQFIPDYAFGHLSGGCAKIKKIEIPSTVMRIGTYAFFGCYALNSLAIPKSVRSLGHMSCMSQSTITMLSEDPPTLEQSTDGEYSVFGPSVKITVPAGCGAVYKAAEGWSEYADRIMEAS